MTAADPQTVWPLPDSDTLDPVVIVHRDAQDAEVYWCGYTNGHDGQGWTMDRRDAMEFPTFSAASLERKVIRRMHPTMSVKLERVP